jgi:hypothetical protein
MAQQAQLVQRVLILVQHIHPLIPALRSPTIRTEDGCTDMGVVV